MDSTGSKIRTVEGGSTCRKGDRTLAYAVVISLVVHFVAVGMIARGYAYNKHSSAVVRQLPKYIKIDLVDFTSRHSNNHTIARPIEKQILRIVTPQLANQSVNVSALPHSRIITPDSSKLSSTDLAQLPRKSLTAALPIRDSRAKSDIRVHTPGNPGGKLNVGTPSPSGDLPGNWSGGSTPVGWVPGNDQESGKGSGSGMGVGSPEPPKQADRGSGTRPAPTPTSAPIKITVRICSISGLRAGEYCNNTRNESFLEGQAPSRICDRCKGPEHNSRLADRANPELIRDSRPTIPSSIPEGLSLTVVIEYTVAADGNVEDIKITKSSGYKALDRAVVDSASQLKYKPAIQDGVPRSVKKTRTYTINT